MKGSAEFTRTRVDGVPAFWTPAGDEVAVGLVFRVGRADEPLAQGGLAHLIEHLVLYPPPGADAGIHYNGQVDSITTTFLTRGGPEQVTGFFRTVCANLRELPTERLRAEKQVLRSEADGRRPGVTDPLLVGRYGAETYGLGAFPEFGVAAVQAGGLKAWADRYFTRGNAALWFAGGPPPGGLTLDLPDGPAMPAPEPASGPRTPAYVNAPVPGVAWSAIVDRSVPAQVCCRVLDRRLRQELRHKQAVTYSPAAAYAVRDRDAAHVIAVADGLPEVHSILVPAFIREIERLEAREVTEDELHSVISALRTAAETPASLATRVKGAARDAIMGRPTRSVASWGEAAAAVSAADVHEVAKAALASSLFVLPPGRQPHRAGFTDAGLRSAPAVTGRRIRSADHPLNREWLVLGDDGVSLAQGQTISTVRFADCAALLTWPDGARELIGRDAVTIRVEPALWRVKDRTAYLGDKVAADRRVDMPAQAGEQAPRPWTRRRTRVAARMLVHPLAAALAGVIPALALLILLTRSVRGAGVITGAVAFPALVIAVAAARFARARLLRRAAAHSTAHNTRSQG